MFDFGSCKLVSTACITRCWHANEVSRVKNTVCNNVEVSPGVPGYKGPNCDHASRNLIYIEIYIIYSEAIDYKH